jgi:hypothetical protein
MGGLEFEGSMEEDVPSPTIDKRQGSFFAICYNRDKCNEYGFAAGFSHSLEAEHIAAVAIILGLGIIHASYVLLLVAPG